MRSGVSYKFLIVVAFSLALPLFVKAQVPDKDTIGIIEKIVDQIDTLVNVVVSDSVLQKWSEQPIDSMLFRNPDSKLEKELYNLIVRSHIDTLKSPTTNTKFAAMDGRIIRKIEYRHVDLFAPSVSDTGYSPVSWFEMTANKTHNDTRKEVLQRYLLMQPGEKLDVFLAADNERILRDLSFIMDAWFVAKPVKGSPDSVDLVLVTQDKFPIGLGLEIENTSAGALGITHQNMLGFGHQLSVTTYYDTENKPHFGYGLSYGTPNIAGTFTSGQLEYRKKWNQESFLLDFSRNFRALSLESAGGFTFENTSITQNIHFIDTIYQLADHHYSITDLWTGRILSPFSRQTQYSRTGIYVAARFSNYNSINQPHISDLYMYPYQDRIRALISLGISSQGFRKDNLIYSFGRTEDVPFGYQFEMTWGGEWLEDLARPYISLSGSYGTYLRNSSYFFGKAQYGTFLNKGLSEQGVFRLHMNYFSRLHKHNRFQYRGFVSFMFTMGINRYPGEYITLSNRRGIEGLSSSSLRGSDKAVLSLESVLFTPYMLFGFKFAFFSGIDLGLIKRESDNTDSRLFSGINFGLRIRNDQLVFNTLVIRLAFYPGRPEGATAENIFIDQVPRIRFNDFLPDRPELVPYQ